MSKVTLMRWYVRMVLSYNVRNPESGNTVQLGHDYLNEGARNTLTYTLISRH